VGASGRGPRSSEVGEGIKARVVGRNGGQPGRVAAVSQGWLPRDGRTSDREPPPAGCVAMMMTGKVQAEAGALMAASFGVGEGCESRRECRGRRADTHGQPGGVDSSGRQDGLPVQGQVGTGWGLDPPARAAPDARAPGSQDATAPSTGPSGSLGATRAAGSDG
jgi:hypothetical protein